MEIYKFVEDYLNTIFNSEYYSRLSMLKIPDVDVVVDDKEILNKGLLKVRIENLFDYPIVILYINSLFLSASMVKSESVKSSHNIYKIVLVKDIDVSSVNSLYFINNDITSILDYSKFKFDNLNLFIGDKEFYPINANNCVICFNDGFYNLDFEKCFKQVTKYSNNKYIFKSTILYELSNRKLKKWFEYYSIIADFVNLPNVEVENIKFVISNKNLKALKENISLVKPINANKKMKEVCTVVITTDYSIYKPSLVTSIRKILSKFFLDIVEYRRIF